MEKWGKVKSDTHREGPVLGHSFYRQLKGGWEGTISQPLVGCLLLERIRMPALHRWLTTEHEGEEGGKEFPLGCYISDPACWQQTVALTSLARISNIVLNRRRKSKHVCLAADFSGEDFHHKDEVNYSFSKTFHSLGLNKFIFIPA